MSTFVHRKYVMSLSGKVYLLSDNNQKTKFKSHNHNYERNYKAPPCVDSGLNNHIKTNILLITILYV